jgi:RHS repeat-associated protein
VQVVTDNVGGDIQPIRYKPYGEIRHFDGDSYNRYRFTGYETEPSSGLAYAGARFYDPDIGLFLTHDPAGEFPNPYTYAGWNPTNFTDPNGECVWDFCIGEPIIGALVGCSVSSIQAAVNGTSAKQALRAGVVGGAIGGATAGIGAGIVQPLLGDVLVALVGEAAGQEVASAVLLGAGLGQAAFSATRGDASGLIGFAVGFALYAVAVTVAKPAGGGSGMVTPDIDLDPAQVKTPPSDEDVRNIVFNETRSLSGPGIDEGRAMMAHSIINADETWGYQRLLQAYF